MHVGPVLPRLEVKLISSCAESRKVFFYILMMTVSQTCCLVAETYRRPGVEFYRRMQVKFDSVGAYGYTVVYVAI